MMDRRPDNFIHLCRLCASYDAVKLDIFGDEGQERSLVQKIQTCLPFQVSADDRLPKSLCYRCMYNLENFYDFRTGCVNALDLLQSCLNPEDGVKNRDKAFLEKRAKIMKQMKRHSQDSDTMPQLEPQVPLKTQTCDKRKEMSPKEKRKTEETKKPVKNKEETDDRRASRMPQLPVAVPEPPVVQVDDDSDTEVDGDFDPSDYLESVSIEKESPVTTSTSLKRKHQEQTDGVHDSSLVNSGCELFTCSVCDKAFSSKGHLSLHFRIHSKEDGPDNNNGINMGRSSGASMSTGVYRPYRCDLCEKSYSSSKHLWGHVSTSHRGDPAVTCPECHRLFSSVFNLEEHKRSKHGEGHEYEDDIEELEDDASHHFLSQLKVNESQVKSVKDDRRSFDEDGVSRGRKRLTPLEESAGNRRKSSKPRKIARTQSNGSNADEEEADAGVVQCVICQASFSSLQELLDHAKKHEGEDLEKKHSASKLPATRTCLLCEKHFSTRSSLNRHLLTQHGIDPIDLHEQQQQPQVEHLQEPKEEILEDPIIDQDGRLLTENMLEPETVFSCECCIREFTDRSSLWLHMLYTHKEAAATACGLCLKVCGDRERLTQHLQTCHNQTLNEKRRYSCKVCMRQHDTRKKLLSHVLIHDIGGDPPDDYIIVNAEVSHMRDDVDDDEENFTDVSAFHDSLGSTSTVVAAAAAAAVSSPFACQICLKIFPNEEKMVKHKQNAHRQDALVCATTGVGNYHLFFRCELCGSSHQSKTDRWRHVYEQHREEPSYLCNKHNCGKVFASAEMCMEHVNHHKVQGAIPNTCEICGKLWSSRVDYWKHMMGVHAEVVPYTCGVCLKVLPDLPQLIDHVRSKHWPLTGGDYCCDICGRPYSNRSKMSRHRKIHFITVIGDNALGNTDEDLRPLSKKAKKSALRRAVASMAASTPLLNSEKSKNVAERFRCEGCPDMEFATREDLVTHRRVDHSMLTCDLCDKFYGRTSHLWKHVNRLHPGHPALTCAQCGKISASRAQLRAHVIKMHRAGAGGALGNAASRNSAPTAPTSLAAEPTPSTKVQKVKRALGPQPCPQCSKVFRNRYRVVRHLKSCSGPRCVAARSVAAWDPSSGPLSCTHCPKTFEHPTALRKHERQSHITYKCELCPAGALPSKTALMDHIRIAHRGAEELTCSVEDCGLVLRTIADREKHESQHRGSSAPPPTCRVCGDLYGSKLRLRKHMVLHHKTDVSTLCGVCLVSMESVSHLRLHVAQEHAAIIERPNTCRVCAKTCGGRYKTLAHIKRCHGNTVVACKECCAIFDKSDDLERHVNIVHCEKGADYSLSEDDEEKPAVSAVPVEPTVEPTVCAPPAEPVHLNGSASLLQPHACELCPKAFKYRKDMIRHVKSKHKSEGVEETHKFSCGACTERFKTENVLLDHYLKAHSELTDSGKKNSLSGDLRPRRSYKCNLCKESFRMPSQLMQHQKIRHRSDNQTLKCASCDKIFSNKVVYLKHQAICRRGTEQTLKCTSCDKLFSNKAILLKHEAICTKDREPDSPVLHQTHRCASCDKVFCNRAILLKHEAICRRQREPDHPIVQLRCTSCDQVFSSRAILVKHEAMCRRESNPSILQQTLESGKVKVEMEETDEYEGIDGFGGHFMDSVDSDANHVGETPPSGKPGRTSRKVYGETEGPVKCTLCDKHWPALKHQWQHLIRTHREAAATTCGVCLKVCSSYKTLATHLHAAHPRCVNGEGNNFTCQICGRYHNARSKLELHNAIHLGLESDSVGPSLFTCSTCFKVFSTTESLELHALNHQAKGSQPVKNKTPVRKSQESRKSTDVNKSDVVADQVADQAASLKHCDRLIDSDSGDDDSYDRSSGNDYSCQRCNKMSFSSYLQLTKHYKYCTSPEKSAKRPASKTNSPSSHSIKAVDSLSSKCLEFHLKRESQDDDSREQNSESQGASSETVSDKVTKSSEQKENAAKNCDTSDESEKKSEGDKSDDDDDSSSDDSSGSSDDSSDDSDSSSSDSKSGSKSDSSDSDDDKDDDDEGDKKEDDESRRAVENLVNDIGTFGSPIYESG